MSPKVNNTVYMHARMHTHHTTTNRFQAADELERKEWMDVLTSAILTGLDTREQTLARVVKQTKSTEILQQIQENPSNKTCADCAASDPVWGVINLGIMVCINCSGIGWNCGLAMCVYENCS
jgi:hypothetical protein